MKAAPAIVIEATDLSVDNSDLAPRSQWAVELVAIALELFTPAGMPQLRPALRLPSIYGLMKNDLADDL